MSRFGLFFKTNPFTYSTELEAVRSTAIVSGVMPYASFIYPDTKESLSESLATRIGLAPSEAIVFAISLPIPELAPVIKTVFPSNSFTTMSIEV